MLFCLSSECGQCLKIRKAITAASHETEQIITIKPVKLVFYFYQGSGRKEEYTLYMHSNLE